MVDYLVRHLEPGVIPSYLKTDQFSDNSQLNLQPILYISELFFSKSHTEWSLYKPFLKRIFVSTKYDIRSSFVVICCMHYL